MNRLSSLSWLVQNCAPTLSSDMFGLAPLFADVHGSICNAEKGDIGRQFVNATCTGSASTTDTSHLRSLSVAQLFDSLDNIVAMAQAANQGNTQETGLPKAKHLCGSGDKRDDDDERDDDDDDQ